MSRDVVLQSGELLHAFSMKLVENVNKTKWLDFPTSKREFFAAFGSQLKHLLFLGLELTDGPLAGNYAIGFPGSQAFGLTLELHHWSFWVSSLLTHPADLETCPPP